MNFMIQLHKNLKTKYVISACFISLVLIWGSSFILIKNGLQAYSNWQAATIRLVSALFVMMALATRHIRNIPRQKIPYVLLVGILGMFIPAYLFCAAETNLNSSMAGILNALTPLFASLFAVAFWGKPCSKKQGVGLAIGFVSTSFLLLINTNAQFTFNKYGLLIIIATICYGINFNIVKNYLSEIKSLHITTVAVSFAGLLALFFLPFSGYKAYLTVDKGHFFPLLCLLTLGVINTALAQLLQNQLIQKSSVAFASSTTYLIPLVAVSWGVLNGEKLVFFHYVGMAGIIVGVWILRK